MVRVTREAREALDEGEALVFDWHRVAICCAAAGEVSLRRAPRERLERSVNFRQLSDGPPVYAHRLAYPHLARRDVGIDTRRFLGVRRFTSNLPPDFGLRVSLGRLPSGEERP